jgi:hypothetical protein
MSRDRSAAEAARFHQYLHLLGGPDHFGRLWKVHESGETFDSSRIERDGELVAHGNLRLTQGDILDILHHPVSGPIVEAAVAHAVVEAEYVGLEAATGWARASDQAKLTAPSAPQYMAQVASVIGRLLHVLGFSPKGPAAQLRYNIYAALATHVAPAGQPISRFVLQPFAVPAAWIDHMKPGSEKNRFRFNHCLRAAGLLESSSATAEGKDVVLEIFVGR